MQRITGFTSRQVATLVAALAIGMLLVPVGAHAAGQLITIVSPDDQNQANVDGKGHLFITDGGTPLRSAIFNKDGTRFAEIGVNGQLVTDSFVHNSPVVPLHSETVPGFSPSMIQGFQELQLAGQGAEQRGAFGARSFAPTDRLAITSITFASSSRRVNGEIVTRLLPNTDANCSDGPFVPGVRRHIQTYYNLPGEFVHLTFPQPLVIRTPSPGVNKRWCMQVWADNVTTDVYFPSFTIIGYVM